MKGLLYELTGKEGLWRKRAYSKLTKYKVAILLISIIYGPIGGCRGYSHLIYNVTTLVPRHIFACIKEETKHFSREGRSFSLHIECKNIYHPFKRRHIVDCNHQSPEVRASVVLPCYR
jgi:hypothetical protein